MINDSHDTTWQRLKAGDISAMECIYRNHVQSLMLYGMKITDDVDMVRDAIHDLFLECWKYRSNLADVVDPRFYLFRALRNKLTRAIANTSFVSISELQLAADDLSVTNIELDIISLEHETYTTDTLKKLMDHLPRRQQEIISLRFYYNFSYETIASVMDMNYQSALNLLQRALKTLRTRYTALNSRP